MAAGVSPQFHEGDAATSVPNPRSSEPVTTPVVEFEQTCVVPVA